MKYITCMHTSYLSYVYY